MNLFNRIQKHREKISKPLQLTLTDTEYEHVIRAIDIADSVYGIMSDMVDERYKPIAEKLDDLQNKLLEHADDFGMGDRVETFKEKNILDQDYTESIMEDLSEFEEMAMWDGLAHKLAWRDIGKAFTDQEWQKLDDRARIAEYCKREEEWKKEFETYGLGRLETRSENDN